MKKACYGVAFFALLMAGCGGGASSPISTQGEFHTAVLPGGGTVTYQGRIVPAVAYSTNGVSIASMAGASFTHVSIAPAQVVQNSLIAYSLGNEIWTYQNGVPMQVTHTLESCFQPALSTTGQIAFAKFDSASGFRQIYACNFDGSGLHRITSSTGNKGYPTWSPSGSKLAFTILSVGEIHTISQSGTGEATLTITAPGLTLDTVTRPAWSPDGTQIAFVGFDSTGNRTTIYVMPSGGGTATSPIPYSNTMGAPSWTSDSKGLVFTESVGGLNYIVAANLDAVAATYRVIATPPSGVTFNTPSFSPDGNTVVYQVSNGGVITLVTQLISQDGSSATIATPTSGAFPAECKWSTYFQTKTFIGTGGQMSTGAGFLWSQAGDGFGSFVSIAATTPSTCSLTLQPGNASGGSAVYLAKADAITNIVYSGAYYGALTTIPTTGSTQALISISTSTGRVDAVAPLAESAGFTRSGSGYAGKFTAVYDATGKNLAPNGSSHIAFDPKSGAISAG